MISSDFLFVQVTIWVRSELIRADGRILDATFDIIRETLQFAKDYLNLTDENIPEKIGNARLCCTGE